MAGSAKKKKAAFKPLSRSTKLKFKKRMAANLKTLARLETK